LVDRLPLEPLGREARARNRRAAAEGLELRVVDDAGRGVHLHLQLHDVAALRRADQARADIRILLRKRSDVARVLVVFNYLFRISHFLLLKVRLKPDTTYENLSPSATASSRDRRLLLPARRAATSRAAASRRSRVCPPRNRLLPSSSTGPGRNGSRNAPGRPRRRAPSVRMTAPGWRRCTPTLTRPRRR